MCQWFLTFSILAGLHLTIVQLNATDITFISGSQSITGLQFDVQYQQRPASVLVSAGNESITAGKLVSSSNYGPSSVRVLIVGPNRTSIGTGVVATVSAAAGESAFVLTNVIGSDESGNAVPLRAGDTTLSPIVPTVQGVANAASYATGVVAPGEIIVIRGISLASATTNTLQVTSSGVAASALGGARVLFDDIPAALVYTTQTQLGAIVPYEVDGKSQTSMQVQYDGMLSATVVLPVSRTAPGVFTLDGSGTGQGAIVNQDGTINGPDHPAPRGSTVSIYATGEGQTEPSGANGRIATASDLRRPLAGVIVSIAGQGAEVAFAGSAGGQVSGLFQVNAVVPRSIPGGAVPVTLKVGEATSQAGVTMVVQ
jgi:uncharacterized protein (TIGR03437 family)